MPTESSRNFQYISANGQEPDHAREGHLQSGGSNIRGHPLLHQSTPGRHIGGASEGPRPSSQESQEITLGENATTDSMVEGMLQLLNDLPDAQGPFPEQPPYESSFVPSGTSFSSSFLQRALGGHRRAQSSLATTTSSHSNSPGSSRHQPTFVSHSRNNTLTQVTYNAKASAPAAMNAEALPGGTPQAPQHKSKFSASSGSARKPSAASLAVSGPNSRTQSPARNPDSEAPDGNRRRSKSFNIPGSVLNRSRPVPAEYHNFDIPGAPSRPGLRKSISNPNHQSRLHEDFPPDLPSDRPFPPSSYLAQYDPDRLSSRAFSSPHMTADLRDINMPSREPSSSFLASSYASSVGSRTQGDMKAPPKSPGKDRPGFFRRMFGNSRNNVVADNRPPQLPPLPVDRRQDPQNLPPPAPQSYASPQPSPLPVPDSPLEPEEPQRPPPQTLKQKSSFFRRRRKTLTDKDQASHQRDESPSAKNSNRPSTSSLRQAMDQYMVHDPMPDDFDLEQLEHVRRNRPEAQDAYEFLRTTSPGMSTSQMANAQVQADVAPAPTLRPSTSVQSSRRVDATDGEKIPDVPGAFPVEPAFPSKPARPVTSPNAPRSKDAEARDYLASKSSTGKRAAKKAPPPLDVSASKSSNKSRWQLIGQTRSGSEKGMDRVPQGDAGDCTKRPENPRSLPSGDSVGTEDFTSAKSIPVPQMDEPDGDVVSPLPATGEMNVPWSASDFEKAQRIWEAQADPAARRLGALELGEAGESGDRLRVAFMSFFDFTGLNILLALRDLCARMTLKGETQQMDRIMAAFSERWYECNPHNGFKSEDVVHTICYSLLLLNTDLHIAELSEKMTQRQFVKNTVPTLRRMAEADTFNPNATIKPNRAASRSPAPWQDVRSSSPASSPDLGATFDRDARSLMLPVAASGRPISGVPSVASPGPYDSNPLDASELLVNSSHEGSMKSWESAMETILKEFYTSIRQLRLPLHGVTEMGPHEQPSNNSLSVVSSIMRRTGSVISKTPSDGSRGRAPELKSASSRWSSKNRSKQRLYASSTLGSSRTGSRTSLDDNSPWSPSASSTWSKSYGNTQTTMSTDSLASRLAGGADPGYQQSIGFANALSHAIIREERSSLEEPSPEGQEPLLEDQALELAGAPWAKEGIVQHKHHLETVDKKAKDRQWSECFAVVEKGVFRLFSFNKPKSSLRSPRTPKGPAAVVGGGNWMDNAAAVGTFTLRQTIANALPPPGYSKSRPYVFALSLPTGAVHLFQVGTPEIAREFVSAANYWSARLSKEPLMGGVSNIEYGWGESVINTALISPASSDPATVSHSASHSRGTITNGPPSSFHVPRTSSSLSGQGTAPPRPSRHSPAPSIAHSTSNSSRPSLQGSLRSSIDAASRPNRARMPADRIALGEWQPPQQSLMASTLSETAQLDALAKYVRGVEDELAQHNELRGAMVIAFSARSVNSQRALGNWERKSSYLLREIVKFRTYVDVLQFAAGEARRVKAEADTAAATPPIARGRIRKVDSHGGSEDDKDDRDDEDGLPEETLEALRMARQKSRGKRSISG